MNGIVCDRCKEKPPIGLRPRHVSDYERMKEIEAAVQRYMAALLPVPSEWLDEYNELATRRPAMPSAMAQDRGER